MSDKLLVVKELKTSFFTQAGEVQAVRGVDFTIRKGEVVGIVGESGSGKSITAKSIMSLIRTPGRIVNGEIIFQRESLLSKSEKEMRKIRGNQISMIFQDPMTSLNPVIKIGKQLKEVINRHRQLSKEQAKRRAIELLQLVGISSPEKRLEQYPHELSGGMRQRVMIAMALSCDPELLIADEPTTALDVTIQAQILELMKELKEKTNTAILLITHDLGVVAQLCTRVIVMYGGLIMEEGKVQDIFSNPQHPYTKGLLHAIPKSVGEKKERLVPIEGSTPNLLYPPKGCPFAPRCNQALSACEKEIPPYFNVQEDHSSRCWLHESTSAREERFKHVFRA